MEIAHELIHVGKELGERDWFDESDGAECGELVFWDGGRRRDLPLDVVVVAEERTCFVSVHGRERGCGERRDGRKVICMSGRIGAIT